MMDYKAQYPEYDAAMRERGWVTWDEVDDSDEYDWWWWHNEDGFPIPVFILKDSGGEMFAALGQHGWGRHQMLSEMQGWWQPMTPPETEIPPFSVDF